MKTQLIIQLQNKNGDFSCEQFDNLPAPKSVYIAICFTDDSKSRNDAIDLKTKLINAISKLSSAFTASTPRCHGNAMPFNGCWALSNPNVLKLLIVVKSGNVDTFAPFGISSWQSGDVLPVLREGRSTKPPKPFDKNQAVFWKSDNKDVVPRIFSLIGISDEDWKIFISYRTKETSPIANQLFSKLNREGFEVFLDRYSLKPSVIFLDKLYQELADKAMVVFLESDNFLKSPWIQMEIAFTRLYRLGSVAVNINNAKKINWISRKSRLYASSPIDISPKKRLSPQKLDEVISKIKDQHSFALYRKRNILNESIWAELKSKGANPSYDVSGFITVPDKTGTKTYKIWTTPRPPKIDNYYYTDISNPSGEKIIFAPEFMEDKRKILNQWIAGKSSVVFFNEGQISDLVKLIWK